MASYHEVRQGECFASLAKRYGFASYRTLYDHAENAALKERRPNPNLLHPGDRVFIPDKEERSESGQTERRHTFRTRRERVRLRLRLRDAEDRPYANKRYELLVNEQRLTGTTDAHGLLEQEVPADAEEGHLLIWLNEDEETGGGAGPCACTLKIGHLDPAEEISGIQARLNNLGFHCGEADGVLGPRTGAALRAFQKKMEMPETGEADEATRARLQREHDQL